MMDDEIGGSGAKMDPSSISLFSAPPIASQASSYGDERASSHLSSPTQTISTENNDHQIQEVANKEPMSYTKYAQQAQRRAALAAQNRRNLMERFERLKNGQGMNFTIPQFSQLTLSQLSQYLQKMRRPQQLAETRSLISQAMLDKLFANEVGMTGATSKTLETFKGSGMKETKRQEVDKTTFPIMAQNELRAFAEEERRMMGRNRFPGPAGPIGGQGQAMFTDDEATEEESTDYEDDDLFGPKTACSAELYDLLQQRQQILAADKQAKRLQEEIGKKLAQTEAFLENLGDNFVFEAPPETNNEEEDSMSCARCRPILAKNSRQILVKHNFKSQKGTSPLRPIISNKKCGTEEYAFTDQSIHPLLSIPSSISMDVQLQKYLHVVSFVPPEIEIRRHKAAQLISKTARKNMGRKFYNLAEDKKEGAAIWRLNAGDDHTNKAIKLSLRKTIMKRGRGRPHKTMPAAFSTSMNSSLQRKYSNDSPTEDENDNQKTDPNFAMPQAMAKKRRRMTMDHHPVKKLSTASKPSKLEGRRMSHVEFGASMFDYDAQLMDIGLPLPAIQKVENVDIDIPSYRRWCPTELTTLQDAPPNQCQICQNNGGGSEDHWAEIRRLHGDLEVQERQQRFPKKVTTHTNNHHHSSTVTTPNTAAPSEYSQQSSSLTASTQQQQQDGEGEQQQILTMEQPQTMSMD